MTATYLHTVIGAEMLQWLPVKLTPIQSSSDSKVTLEKVKVPDHELYYQPNCNTCSSGPLMSSGSNVFIGAVCGKLTGNAFLNPKP
ncbi:Hypothetical protein SMAX5B_003643 [Scophthalmus maximus]|uniref:Uncharacterized protein n=1 Tax=Scophthalmus maximus TaxID=52904 RepID=A0A2U9CHP2_SCOMX|nr:Hypothetical protein SMAX5B_003643 [Scophthalmus maximus]